MSAGCEFDSQIKQKKRPAKSQSFDNAGGLYGNANKENFPNVNDYRNPVIAEAMKLLGYVNRYNRGIARVQKELRENGNGDAYKIV